MSRRSARKRRRFGYVFARKWPSGRKTWSAQWFDQTQGNKRVTRHFDTEKEANDFLDELERRIVAKVYETPPTLAETMHLDVAPQPATPEVPTFVEYAEALLSKRLAASLAKNTLNLYSANLLALNGFYGPRDRRPALRLDEVTIASFLDYRAFRRDVRNSPDGRGGTVSAATVNRDQQFASRVLAEAVLDGHIERNPLAGLRKLKEPRKARRYLTREEVVAVIKHAPRWFRPLVVAAVTTGARKCELTRLRWSDIDFAAGKIALFRQKVGNADLLDLHPDLATELRKLRARREKKKGDVAADEHVFLSRRGTPFTNISKSWALTLRRAGLEGRGLTPHGLRHSFATFYLEGGGAVPDLQQQLGHAALATTQIYAASLSERRRAAVLALDFRGKRRNGAGKRTVARRAAAGS